MSLTFLYLRKRTCRGGGYSTIDTELFLLEKATSTDDYRFYHFLTGQDLPIKNSEYIYNYFTQNIGKEFICIKEICDPGMDNTFDWTNRIRFWFIFQEMCRITPALSIIQRLIILLQRLFRVNRLSDKKMIFGFGSAYFDIENDFAEYLVSEEEQIRKLFRYSCCADEIFIQTMYLNWKEKTDHSLHFYDSNNKNDIKVTNEEDIVREIDWSRGENAHPYTWRQSDYQYLKNSQRLFARKFSESTDATIIRQIVEMVTKNT